MRSLEVSPDDRYHVIETLAGLEIGDRTSEKKSILQDKIRAKFVEYVPEKSEIQDIASAEVIVSGGRGLGKPEGFKMVEALARLLGGAVGASRAVVDAGWIPYRHQVGLTGRTVRPKVYWACGISGAIQHLAGMSSSEFIIAVNKDPQALMMQLANLAVEGDVYELIPAIIKEIHAVKN